MGNPVAHSKSPRIHQAFAIQTSQTLRYEAILVPADGFAYAVHVFRQAGGKGLNVTVPFKEEAWRLATVRTARAELAGAVNTLSFSRSGEIHGDNTDGTGLLRDLEHNHVELATRRILILGAGGAVRGVIGPLMERYPSSIVIANRTLERAETLIRQFSQFSQLSACSLEDLPGLGSFDLIINATSSGLHGELPALPDGLIHPQSCCYDMVYGDAEPVFVKWAKQHGAHVALDGLGMLVEQAAEAFYVWRGVRPDTIPVIAMLRGQLARP
jgi:shikimate dehydrogenase